MIARFLTLLVKGYRLLLSPSLGSSCRFEPTCSAYALQALELHGAAKGSYLTLSRIGRCHPWCEGGLDPVPPTHATGKSGFLTRLVSPTSQKKSS